MDLQTLLFYCRLEIVLEDFAFNPLDNPRKHPDRTLAPSLEIHPAYGVVA